MMTTKTQPIFIFYFIAALLSSSAADLPEAMMTLKVLGEDNQPIVGANATILFEQVSPDGKSISKQVKGVTDNTGTFSGRARTIPNVYYGAGKTDYYESDYAYDFSEPQNGRWLPWNPTLTVVLKKKINPVPMYAKRVWSMIPADNKEVGFDLQEADWVAPHGKGRVPDFVFQLTRRFTNDRDYKARLRLSFSGAGDGIQSVFVADRYGSELRLPHNAPADGYQPVWERTDSYSNPAHVREDQNYFFRVRSQSGKTLYGKIHGEIKAVGYGTAKASVNFTYYLNPDGTRNVEFDPKRNLLNDLNRREQVQQP